MISRRRNICIVRIAETRCADSSKFCSHCGQLVEPETSVPDNAPAAAQRHKAVQTGADKNEENIGSASKKPMFEEFQWNVDDYPGRRKYEKTEDVDFDWNAKPQDIPDTVTGQPQCSRTMQR